MRDSSLIVALVLIGGVFACSAGQEGRPLPKTKPTALPELSNGLQQLEWTTGKWHVFCVKPLKIANDGWKVWIDEPIDIEVKDSHKISIAYRVVFHHQQADVKEEFEVNEFIECDAADNQLVRFYGITNHKKADHGTTRRDKKRFLTNLVMLRDNEFSLTEKDETYFLKNVGGIRMARTLLFDSKFALYVVCQKIADSEKSDRTTW